MRKVGRPPKFESPEELIDLINLYFSATDEDELTVTGLCLSMGTTRETLDDYLKKDNFKKIVTQAKLHIENSYEKSLRKNGRSGDIFALKNFGWKDKTETELSGGLAMDISSEPVEDSEEWLKKAKNIAGLPKKDHNTH